MFNKETTISDFINLSGYKTNKIDYALFLKRPYKKILGKTACDKNTGHKFKVIKAWRWTGNPRRKISIYSLIPYSRQIGYVDKRYVSYYKLRKYYV